MFVISEESILVPLILVLSNSLSVALTCWCLRRMVLETRPQVPEAEVRPLAAAPAAQAPAAQPPPTLVQPPAAQAPAAQAAAGPFMDVRLVTMMHTRHGEVWHLSPDCPSLVSNRWVQRKRPCNHCVH